MKHVWACMASEPAISLRLGVEIDPPVLSMAVGSLDGAAGVGGTVSARTKTFGRGWRYFRPHAYATNGRDTRCQCM